MKRTSQAKWESQKELLHQVLSTSYFLAQNLNILDVLKLKI